MPDTLPNSPYLDLPLRSEAEAAALRKINALRRVEDEHMRSTSSRGSLRSQVTESIYGSATLVIPMADVQHIEKSGGGGLVVVTRHTQWNAEAGCWANNIFVPATEADAFLRAWCTYRSELEADILADLSPEARND